MAFGESPDAHSSSASRFLTPRTGLILGSGGILGAAHAGVIGVLGEAGVQIDAVVGASVGAIFAVAVAAGLDLERIRRSALECRFDATFRLYLNRLRVDARTPIGRLLSDIGPDTKIEDLPKPLACMVLDWDTGEVVALKQGPALRAVQASMALPWIARPVVIDGRRCMDGGLRGPVPVPVARDMGADRVISVRLVGKRDQESTDARRRTGQIRSRLARFREGTGKQPPFLLRAPSFDSLPSEVPEYADLEIWPDFRGLSRTAPFGHRFCIRQGERATREALRLLRTVEGSHPAVGLLRPGSAPMTAADR